MTERQATPAEIRKHYTDAGHMVRISRGGHVTYKQGSEGPWLEGRWVSEYRISDQFGVRA